MKKFGHEEMQEIQCIEVLSQLENRVEDIQDELKRVSRKMKSLKDDSHILKDPPQHAQKVKDADLSENLYSLNKKADKIYEDVSILQESLEEIDGGIQQITSSARQVEEQLFGDKRARKSYSIVLHCNYFLLFILLLIIGLYCWKGEKLQVEIPIRSDGSLIIIHNWETIEPILIAEKAKKREQNFLERMIDETSVDSRNFYVEGNSITLGREKKMEEKQQRVFLKAEINGYFCLRTHINKVTESKLAIGVIGKSGTASTWPSAYLQSVYYRGEGVIKAGERSLKKGPEQRTNDAFVEGMDVLMQVDTVKRIVSFTLSVAREEERGLSRRYEMKYPPNDSAFPEEPFLPFYEMSEKGDSVTWFLQ